MNRSFAVQKQKDGTTLLVETKKETATRTDLMNRYHGLESQKLALVTQSKMLEKQFLECVEEQDEIRKALGDELSLSVLQYTPESTLSVEEKKLD